MLFIHDYFEEVQGILSLGECSEYPVTEGDILVISTIPVHDFGFDVISEFYDKVSGDYGEDDMFTVDITDDYLDKFIAEHIIDSMGREEIEKENITNISILHACSDKLAPSAIEIILGPADKEGHTLAISGDFRKSAGELVSQLKEQFGDFILMCIPSPLPSKIDFSHRADTMFLCRLYCDNLTSSTRGVVFAGNICPECGRFFHTYPGQMSFCHMI